MFTINRLETSDDGHFVSFLAVNEVSGEVLGSAFAGLVDNHQLRLDLIQTNPPLRKHGIGSALLAAVISWGQKRGTVRLTGEFKPDSFAKPQDVERFYAKRGISITPDGNLGGKL